MLTLYLHQTDGFFLYLVASKQHWCNYRPVASKIMLLYLQKEEVSGCAFSDLAFFWCGGLE